MQLGYEGEAVRELEVRRDVLERERSSKMPAEDKWKLLESESEHNAKRQKIDPGKLGGQSIPAQRVGRRYEPRHDEWFIQWCESNKRGKHGWKEKALAEFKLAFPDFDEAQDVARMKSWEKALVKSGNLERSQHGNRREMAEAHSFQARISQALKGKSTAATRSPEALARKMEGWTPEKRAELSELLRGGSMQTLLVLGVDSYTLLSLYLRARKIGGDTLHQFLRFCATEKLIGKKAADEAANADTEYLYLCFGEHQCGNAGCCLNAQWCVHPGRTNNITRRMKEHVTGGGQRFRDDSFQCVQQFNSGDRIATEIGERLILRKFIEEFGFPKAHLEHFECGSKDADFAKRLFQNGKRCLDIIEREVDAASVDQLAEGFDSDLHNFKKRLPKFVDVSWFTGQHASPPLVSSAVASAF
ncbi:unnamed protein product, partial [Amoebophrya sp. A120]|eukprot:GSA120T00012324001.1